MMRWGNIKELGTEVSSQLAWRVKAARHWKYAPRGDLVAWWFKMHNMFHHFPGLILLHHPFSLIPHLPSLSSFKIKAKLPAKSLFFPPPYLLDMRYTRFKEATNLLWKERSFQSVWNSLKRRNRSRAMVILCTKDPKRALTQSDKIPPIALRSFISNNHTETHGCQTHYI